MHATRITFIGNRVIRIHYDDGTVRDETPERHHRLHECAFAYRSLPNERKQSAAPRPDRKRAR